MCGEQVGRAALDGVAQQAAQPLPITARSDHTRNIQVFVLQQRRVVSPERKTTKLMFQLPRTYVRTYLPAYLPTYLTTYPPTAINQYVCGGQVSRAAFDGAAERAAQPLPNAHQQAVSPPSPHGGLCGLRSPYVLGCYVITCAPHKALKLIARCKLTSEERVVLHRVES